MEATFRTCQLVHRPQGVTGGRQDKQHFVNKPVLWSHLRGNIRPILQSARRDTCQKMIGSGDVALLLEKNATRNPPRKTSPNPEARSPVRRETRQKRKETDQQTSSKAVLNFFQLGFWVGALVVLGLGDGALAKGITPIANRGLLFGNRSRGTWTVAWKGTAPASFQESLLKSGPLRSHSRGKDWSWS